MAGNQLGRGSRMDKASVSVEDSDRNGAEASGLLRQTRRHQSVDLEEVLDGCGTDFVDQGVGGLGVLDFLDFAGRTEDAAAVDDVGDLLECEGVLFDGQGGVDGAEAVLLAQKGVDGALAEFQVRGGFGNLGDERNHLVREGVGRFVGGGGGFLHGPAKKRAPGWGARGCLGWQVRLSRGPSC